MGAGHDIASIADDAPGSTDKEVLARSTRERRVLLTFDKDFGELVFRAGAAASAGVILFRISPVPPDQLAREIVGIVASRTDWANHFTVVESGQLRMRELPEITPAT